MMASLMNGAQSLAQAELEGPEGAQKIMEAHLGGTLTVELKPQNPSSLDKPPAATQQHWKSLIILNFPSHAEDDWLFEAFLKLGFDIDSVTCKSSGKNMKLVDGKAMYAFVNCKSADTARNMKEACDDARIVINEAGKKRKWTLKADWAASNGFRSEKQRDAKEKKNQAKKAAKDGESNAKAEGKTDKVDLTIKLKNEGKKDANKVLPPSAISQPPGNTASDPKAVLPFPPFLG
jgi:hypothetical protein